MAGPASNYEDEILQAIREAVANQGAYKRYAPDASNQTLNDGTQLLPESVVPQDVAAIVQGMQRARR